MNQQILLLAFAALMIVAATAMLIRSSGPVADTATHDDDPQISTGPRPAAETGPASPTLTAPQPATAAPASTGGSDSRTARNIKIMAAAVVLGFLTGFLGVGGGFLIVPALVLVLGLTMPPAVGTSLVIIAITSIAAFTQRLGQAADIPWQIVLPFLGAAIIGSLLGKRVTARMTSNTLTRAFAGLLLAVAAYVAIQASLQL